MPDPVFTPQAELEEGYRAIVDALDYRNSRDDLQRVLAILGYTVTVLFVALKHERRFERAAEWASILLENTHRGILRELTDSDDDPDA